MTKTFKKSVAFLSAAVMVMAMLLYFPSGLFSNIDWGLKASAEGGTETTSTPWDGTVATSFAAGEGTEGDPYQIATAEQLAHLAQQVNAGNYSGNYFKLTADIDLGGKEWTPIGTDETKAFTGEFSGDGHKITNLKIERTGDYVGLFGCNMGKITNVGIEGGSVKGGKYVGGVCGSNSYGTISNCYNTGGVTGTGTYVGGVCGDNGGSISNCYNTGNVTGGEKVGGVCGTNGFYATISNCYNTGKVTGTGEYNVGGVCGNNTYGTISNCYNTGDVSGSDKVGGVCGYNSSPISNCYNTGKVTGTGENVGGVCGENDSEISNCYYLEGTSSTGIGNDSGSAVPKTLNELCELDLDDDGTAWTAGSYKEETNVRMRTLTYTLPSLNGVGTAQTIELNYYNFSTTDEPDWQEYISIRTAEELQAIGKDSTSFGKNYVLMEDIDLKDITDFTPIGTDENNAFTGKFSGNGHKITNLTINSESKNVGLFGFSNGTIMNVGIEGGSVTGKVYVGGVCGENSGTISNCYNTGKVTGTGSLVGGVCGYNYSTGKISYCYNTGAVSGNSYVGGVCGNNKSGTISNCYFDSKVYNGNAVGNNNGTVYENVLGKTTKQFTRGEVAYLLQSGQTAVNGTIPEVWGQEIGKDLYPVLGGKKVYLTTGECVYYTNTFYEEEQSHSYKNGICDNCGGYLPAALTNDKYDIDGDGIKDAVYEISNASQLYWFADKVYYDNGNFGSANAVLTADITVNTGNVAGCNGTKAEGWRDWTPIGNNDNQYTGTFDGQNHKISGLYFNDTGTDYVGLFGYSGGTIKNVGVVNSYFKGKEKVGGVCGFNDAYNYNSTATITNCYNTGYVSVSGNGVGGVCGNNKSGTISNCYNTGAVNGTGDSVGGVCGFTTGGTIANCYFDSTVYNGNAVGYNYGTDSENVLGKETTQFTSGEVAYLLSQGCTVGGTIYNGDVWGQEIGKDLYPVLGGEKVLANSDQSAFANDIIIYGQSATLDGMIGMNIYVAADDNYEWSASFNGNPVEKPAKDENGLYKFTYQVAAKDMAKNIDFYINENVKATVSVSGYLTELKKSESENTKLANLVTAMETYGNAANAFFNGNPVAEVTGIAENAFDDYTFTMGDPPYGISYYGSSLILESETTIRHYFKLPEGCEAESLIFGAGTEQGNPVEKQGYYYVEIKNISAEKLGNPFSVSVDGDAVISNYSALSYAKAVLESENTDANLKNLVKALYIYYQNAIAYNEPAKEDLK